MRAIVITPPSVVPLITYNPSVFLAGSIEMDKAELWQDKLITELADLDITILNPRRADWDSTWVCTKDNPQFREQVEWELNGLRQANAIAMYLAPGTVSPISLLELGLFINQYGYDGKLFVCCPDGFARKGNVDIVCERFGVPVYTDWVTWVAAIRGEPIL